MFNSIALCIVLLVVIKSIDSAIHYSSAVAGQLGLSKHVIGFLLVAGISALPETIISIVSAIDNEPSFGLGTLFGSNVADLTLVFFVILLFAKSSIRISSAIFHNIRYYTAILAIPLLFGINGFYSRLEGVILILVGLTFHFWVVHTSKLPSKKVVRKTSLKDWAYLLISLACLIIGSQLTVTFGVNLAHDLGIQPVLIGLFVVALGTTLPELLFSIRAVQQHRPSLALGDILGTVMTDATIVVGIVAIITPFAFPQRIIYITGIFMLLSALLLFYSMKTHRELTRLEGAGLLLFYILFVATELLVNTAT